MIYILRISMLVRVLKRRRFPTFDIGEQNLSIIYLYFYSTIPIQTGNPHIRKSIRTYQTSNINKLHNQCNNVNNMKKKKTMIHET